jgi:hypothetical protein
MTDLTVKSNPTTCTIDNHDACCPGKVLPWLTLANDKILDCFACLPGGDRHGTGDKAFAFVKGNRPDRVLLVAHVDTVFDRPPGSDEIAVKDGVISSRNPDIGIGADDRAGVAILWELRNSGHSLLLTCGEEQHGLAAHAIANSPQYRELHGEISRHCFIVEFDRRGGSDLVYYDVGTPEFAAYCACETGYSEAQGTFTDICELNATVAAVNVSCGYHDEHWPRETLNLAEWHSTLAIARRWLAQNPLPRFPR